MELLRDLVIVFAAAVLVVAVLRRLGVPTIAGLIATGILAGPGALGIVRDTTDIERLAEVGVVRAGATQVISMELEGANRVADWVAGRLE
ncbi:MAG: cation:proton antiporter [Acidobacteriota bacterium]